MRYLKNFKLFEAVKPEHILPTSIYDTDSFINYLAYIETGIAKGNHFKDFKMWLVYTALKEALKEDTFYHYKEDLKGRENELKSLIDYPTGYDGKDYFREELDKITNDTQFKTDALIETVSESIKYLTGEPKTINDPEIGKAIKEAFKKIIYFFIKDVFYPGKMDELKNLKFLDAIDEATLDNFLIKNNLIDALDQTFKNYAKMERNSSHLGAKFFKFLKTVGESGINVLINIEPPEFFVDSIVTYFKESEDSFKVADEIRKSNTFIYDKIKQYLPNIDTAADLGDLGF